MTRYLFLFLSFLMIGCSSKKTRIPKDILPKDSMQSIMWDMMRVDELATYNSLKDSTYKKMPMHMELYQTVFKIHNISDTEFKKSLRYYTANPQLLKDIFDSLGKKVEQPEVMLPPVKRKIRDSMK